MVVWTNTLNGLMMDFIDKLWACSSTDIGKQARAWSFNGNLLIP